ncbi:hypothetical protein [Thalassoroseus pseudoceratinae]|uniref:hypothetical protein n=1 Tax=Thalassoroseus pseudoceratinae TaxID=2713176 RepID=UPI00141F7E81|nr:hypothetical protein [Thalassoroseus pseudoceratinae]
MPFQVFLVCFVTVFLGSSGCSRVESASDADSPIRNANIPDLEEGSIGAKVERQTTTTLEGKPLDLKKGVKIGQKFLVTIDYTIPASPETAKKSVLSEIVFVRPDGSKVIMQAKHTKPKPLDEGSQRVAVELFGFKRSGDYQIELACKGIKLIKPLPIKILPN